MAEAWRSSLPVAFTVLALAAAANRWLVGVEAGVGCSKGGFMCHAEPEVLEYERMPEVDELESERLDIDPVVLSAAVPLIEERLEQRGRPDEYYMNIKEMEVIALDEIDAKYLKNQYSLANSKPKPTSKCLSSRLNVTLQREWIPNSDIMINALLRLMDLRRVDYKKHTCDPMFNHDLRDVNTMAGDPAGRHWRKEPTLYKRIDGMVIETIVRRSVRCFLHYREVIRNVTRLDGYNKMKPYLNQLFDYQMSKVRPNERGAEALFGIKPESSYRFVRDLPHAMEPGDMHIARNWIETKRRRHSNDDDKEADTKQCIKGINKVLKMCKTYEFLVAGVFDAYELDMLLEDVIPEKVVEMAQTDYMISKGMSYYLLCRKLENDMNHVLSPMTSGSL